jgi:hypothetical protein
MNRTPILSELTREWVRRVDAELGRRLTEIVGHAPSAEEVRRSGACVVTPDHVRTYTWDGIPFLVVKPIGLSLPPDTDVLPR